MKKVLVLSRRLFVVGALGAVVGIAGLQTNSGVSDFAQDCPE